MHIKKQLSFTALRKKLSNRLLEMEDKRDQSKVKHSIHDCFMSGFAMIFFSGFFFIVFSAQDERETLVGVIWKQFLRLD